MSENRPHRIASPGRLGLNATQTSSGGMARHSVNAAVLDNRHRACP